MKKQTLTCLIVLSFTFTLSAQYNPSEVFYYKGKVVTDGNKPVAFAHVINKKRKYATVTDTLGNYRMSVFSGDSIKISAIGYHEKYVSFNQNTAETEYHVIKLKKKAYDLPIVNINELRWQVFKSEFLEKELEEDKDEKRALTWVDNLLKSDEVKVIQLDAKRFDWLHLDPYKALMLGNY